jgi:hypothetical protein
MAEILFSHPDLTYAPIKAPNCQVIGNGATGSTLQVNVRPNSMVFNYGLNTQAYPTYAGEVVQILSAYIDNFQIEGDIQTYLDIELIYKWFIAYMTIATQGNNSRSYDQNPITFSYPHRGWTLQIRPISLPNFAYGTQVVVPSWQLEAQVVDSELFNKTTITNPNFLANAIANFQNISANLAPAGLLLDNPFASPDYDNSTNAKKFLNGIQPLVNPNDEQLQDWYQNLLSTYADGSGNLDSVSSLLSQKASPPSTGNQTIQTGSSSTSSLGSLGLTTGSSILPGTSTVPGTQAIINSDGTASAPENLPSNIQSIVAGVIAGGNSILPYPYLAVHQNGFSIPPAPGGVDCSSSVSYALHGGGLLSDIETSGSLETFGDAGVGQYITIYTNVEHVFMYVCGIILNTVQYADIQSHAAPLVVPPAQNTGAQWQPGSLLETHLTYDLSDHASFIARHPSGL